MIDPRANRPGMKRPNANRPRLTPPLMTPPGMNGAALRVARGLLLLARFRPSGFGYFGAGSQQVLESLAPLVAFPLVFGVLALLESADPQVLASLLATVVALVTPLVVSEAFARRWGRDGEWGRFAVAFNWCQWAMMAAFAGALVLATVLMAAGLPPDSAAPLVMGIVLVYGLSLHWFLVRHGLALSRGRTTLVVAAMTLATVGLVAGPMLLAPPAPPPQAANGSAG